MKYASISANDAFIFADKWRSVVVVMVIHAQEAIKSLIFNTKLFKQWQTD